MPKGMFIETSEHHEKRCSLCGAVKSLSDYYRINGHSNVHRSSCKSCHANYYQRNRATKLEVLHCRRAKLKVEILDAYGNECILCGETQREFLSLDHINGGGTVERYELGRKGTNFYAYLKRQGWPDGYCTLCHSCNQSLGRPKQNSTTIETVQSRYRAKLRAEILEVYGKECACCGEARTERLALDHVNGSGGIERRKLGITSGSNFYCYLRKRGWPIGYRILCHNCNQSLGYYGYCPHNRTTYVNIATTEITLL